MKGLDMSFYARCVGCDNFVVAIDKDNVECLLEELITQNIGAWAECECDYCNAKFRIDLPAPKINVEYYGDFA